MVALLALVIVGVLALVALAMVIEVIRRLFWLAAQLATSAAVALVGAVCVLGLAPPGTEWLVAPIVLALVATVLWASRGWGRKPATADPLHPVRVIDAAGFRASPAQAADRAPEAATREAAAAAQDRVGRAGGSRFCRRAGPGVGAADAAANPRTMPPLLMPALRNRLIATEAALAHAARDDVGQPAADWLTFWRRRIPDLISAAQDVWDDAGDAEKSAIAADLSTSLNEIAAEAEERLDAIRRARRDLFTTRANHARARVREG